MSSYLITFTASVNVEAETSTQLARARDAIEDAVAEAMPEVVQGVLDTYDDSVTKLSAAEAAKFIS
jgi:hypothetical protein